MKRIWLAAIASASLLPADARAQRAIALGAGPTAGLVGVEVLWTTAARRAAVGVGGGVAGRGLVADVGAGVVLPHGGTWGGGTLGPGVRLQVGWAF